MRLNAKSHRLLGEIHSDLAIVISAAAYESPVIFEVTEGLRTYERQKNLVKAGASKTLNSRHLTGHAVDIVCIVNGEARWDWPLYERVAQHILMIADNLTIPVVWGGNWPTFRDGPHYELDRNAYPSEQINKPKLSIL